MRRSLAFLALPIALLFVGFSAATAHASSFNAGKIIDDVIFTNNASMPVTQIQSFLNSKVPTCDTDGTMPASDFGRPDLTHAQYASMVGWPGPPYTCLKDYVENGISSAQLIYNLSQQYQINPQVLIVTLQKESSLVTDYWPLSSQYKTATGYGCPDSGPNNSANCNSSYYGLTNQLSHTAYMYRAILNQDPNWYSPYVVGTNYIQWNPNAGCGGTNVDIQNWSTAALYDYTPYQPNAAALNAGYGMGDSCSAYGNRNFWLYFTDWFGSTEAPSFAAQPVWQQVYTDSTKSTALGWNANIVAGQSAYVAIAMKNVGNMTWTQSGAFGTTDTRLATYGPWGRTSSFCDGTWVINCTRPAALKEASVAPGQTGTFEFSIKAPTTPGTYMEAFSPVVDGRTVFTSGAAAVNFNIAAPSFAAQPVWQQVYTDSTKSTALGWDASLFTRQRAWLVEVVKNVGNMTWTQSGAFGTTDTRLATYGPWGRTSSFCDGTWVINCTRPAALKEASVAPGQTGTFEFPIVAPDSPGDYSEGYAPIVDGRTVFNGWGTTFNLKVHTPTFAAQPVWQQVYTDSTKSTALGWDASLNVGQPAYIVVAMKNTGDITWTQSGAFGTTDTRLATYGPWGRTSSFCDGTWVINCTRPAALKEASVAPGQTGTFEFSIKAPTTPGTYMEAFSPVVDGRTVFSSGGMGINFTVH